MRIPERSVESPLPATPPALLETPLPRAVPVPVDVVNVFRRPEFVPDVAADAIAIGARAL